MSFYPRLFEAKFSQVKLRQEWLNSYKKDVNADYVDARKPFEILRANFGPNDNDAAKNKIINFLQNSIGISSDTYIIITLPDTVVDKDTGKQLSGEFYSYKILFIKSTTDIFGNKYDVGDYLYITNRFKGKESIIGKKDLNPDKMGLTSTEYSNPIELLSKVKLFLDNTNYPENYKKFILESSKKIISDSKNNNKFEDFSEYAKQSPTIIYNIPPSLFDGIEKSSINKIQTDYGEVLAALMFFNILKNVGSGLRYPSKSNARLIDFYFDGYRVSSKAGVGAIPSGDTIVKLINNAHEKGEVSFTKKDEIDFYENFIIPWINATSINRSAVYNTIMSLAKIHLSHNKNSGYSYLLSKMKISPDFLTKQSILSFMDKLVYNKNQYTEFINNFMDKTHFKLGKYNKENYRLNYINKINDPIRIGLIFYPIVIELAKILNIKYADLLTKYAQKVIVMKQVHLTISIETGEFKFETKTPQNSSFVFIQRGSINNPFDSNMGIKMKD